MEYCGVELTEEGLQHYGVKGMHWGVRRYQPYPKGTMTKRQAKKAVRIINSNAKRNAIKNYYKDESTKAYQIYMSKAKEAMRDNKDKKAENLLKKAGKEMGDVITLHEQIKNGKAQANKALQNLKENGFNTTTNTKIKRFVDLGRTFADLTSPAGIENARGRDVVRIQRPYTKTKLEKGVRYNKPEHKGINRLGKANSAVSKIGFSNKYYPNRKWTYESATKALKKDNVQLTDLEMKEAKRINNSHHRFLGPSYYYPSIEHLYEYEKKRRANW